MKSFLFAALLVGCLISISYAQAWHRDEFEFVDTNGNCWRCAPGFACERCKTRLPQMPNVDLPDFNNFCVEPDCSALSKSGHLSARFPSVISRKYYQCVQSAENALVFVPELRDCPCDTFFSFQNQRCEWAFDWVPHCTNLETPVDNLPCPNPDDIPPGGVTTTTTTTLEPTTTTTTEVSTTTTASSCTCIPWWPCWCNPCWNMPCGSCSGCLVG